MALQKYNKMRDFAKTAEPRGAVDTSGARRFVIQKHEASHLHYDFRLELGGTLKSWAVPKGPPFAKGEKRLAMEVEDHPVAYRTFEGTIPKGEYGGGTVMVWDQGTFEPLSDAPLKELAKGKLHFVLSGKKLKGEWYLVRTARGEDKRQWLLIKGGADMKPVSAKSDDTSALSGRSMKQIEKGGKGAKVWKGGKSVDAEPEPAKKKGAAKAATQAATPAPASRRHEAAKRLNQATAKKAVRRKPLLKFFDPMKARLVSEPPPGDWEYEIKFDGYRALAFVNEGAVRLLSRNEKNLAEKFSGVTTGLKKLKVSNTVLDGEIVALDPKGHSSFQLLQSLELGQEQPPLFYYVFDLPQHEGEDLRGLPLRERRARLEKLLRRAPSVLRLSESLGSDGAGLLKQAEKLGLEGLIGKRAGSLYETGKRTGSWIKLKTHREQEFVIGGYSLPEGGRSHFGALLLGVHQGKDLAFCGKVGTGFTEAILKSLGAAMKKLERKETPFVNLPEARTGRYGSGVTAAEMKRCRWVTPRLVAQVKFAEWTRDGKLRQPVFLGLRRDKDAAEVVREEPADA
jgi:bifunctional non-homologous end joining protein LigD